MVAWVIYYDAGKTFSSEDGLPVDAPARGVQMIAEADPAVGCRLQEGSDYYIRRCDKWIGVDLIGLIDQLCEAGLVKLGRMLTDEEFRAVKTRAMADKQTARKSARHPLERR